MTSIKDASETKPESLQVIVAGLPRTGTTSMTSALKTLLNAPVFDGGHVSWFGTVEQQKLLLDLSLRCPIRSQANREFVLAALKELTTGYVASSDQPGCYFLGELLELYPKAKVIVTIRDPNTWWPSYCALWSAIGELYLWSILDPFSSLRRFCVFSVKFWDRVPQAVGLPGSRPWWPLTNHEGLYEAHAEYVQRVVPKDQLFYVDVKDGWAPLCQILGIDVPKDEPFPHVFPRVWLEDGVKKQKARLQKRLAIIFGLITVLLAIYLYL